MYDTDFYRCYEAYLRESVVRSNHNFAFNQFRRMTKRIDLSVMDLGCAVGEYFRYGSHTQYVGVDVNESGVVPKFVQANYRDISFVNRLPFKPNAFVSLFSAECCLSVKDKYEFYRQLFETIPSLRFALVAGFFYESRADQETVGETGGIVSYQTIEAQAPHISPLFREQRLCIHTPSRMFGPDVIEIWKFLTRH